MLFWQFPGWRGPHPAGSHPSPPWTRSGTCHNAPGQGQGGSGRDGRGPAHAPARAGQSRHGAAFRLARGAFVSQSALTAGDTGGRSLLESSQGGVGTVPGTGRGDWALEKECQGASPRRSTLGRSMQASSGHTLPFIPTSSPAGAPQVRGVPAQCAPVLTFRITATRAPGRGVGGAGSSWCRGCNF